MIGNTVSEFVADNFFYVFLALAVLSVIGRRFEARSQRKRVAILTQAIAVFLLVVVASAVMEFGGNDLYLYAAVVVIGVLLATVFRQRAFPYRRTCPSCGKKLDWNTITFRDDNLCLDCRPDPEEEETRS